MAARNRVLKQAIAGSMGNIWAPLHDSWFQQGKNTKKTRRLCIHFRMEEYRRSHLDKEHDTSLISGYYHLSMEGWAQDRSEIPLFRSCTFCSMTPRNKRSTVRRLHLDTPTDQPTQWDGPCSEFTALARAFHETALFRTLTSCCGGNLMAKRRFRHWETSARPEYPPR